MLVDVSISLTFLTTLSFKLLYDV